MALVNKSEMIDPFFEVSIGPPNARKDQMIKLPPWLQKLFHTFQYDEVRNGGETSASRIKLVILEYKNKPGSILDLRLDQDLLKFADPNTVKEGSKNVEEETSQETIQSDKTLETVDKQKAQEAKAKYKEKEKKVKPRYLIQENNTVEIIFGYRSGKTKLLTPRRVRGEMLQITHKASQEGIPLTEISSVDTGTGEFSKMFPEQGVNFTRAKVKELLNNSISDSSNRPDTAPARIDDIINAIASKLVKNTETNIQLTVDELKLDIQDATSSRTWGIHTNLHSFLKKLAEKLFCHYFMTMEMRDGDLINVINVISRSKYEDISKFNFMWKSGQGDAGSNTNQKDALIFNTLLSYDLQLYPVGGNGGSSIGVNSESKKLDGSNDPVGLQLRAMRDKAREKVLETAKAIKADRGLADKTDVTGASTYSPTNSTGEHTNNVNRLSGRMSANLRLTFNTIGIPQLSPQTVQMSNIGERYNGYYYILSVSHTINAEHGYTCSAVGEGNSVRSGGVQVPTVPSKQADTDKTATLTLREDPSVGKKQVLDTVKIQGE